MCQLAAYVGDRPKASVLLKAIESQEPYLGAHASGLGVITSEGEIRIEKDVGYVSRVRETTRIDDLEGTVGIAHSRWGNGYFDPRYNTKKMAHPFIDCNESLCLMHNGVISNFEEHWQRLRERHPFRSYEAGVNIITDSEIAVHMLEEEIDHGLNVEEGLREIAPRLTGSFLLACMSIEEPDTVWIANWYQPCVVGLNDKETMFCSSPMGFDHLRDVFDKIFEPPKNSLLRLGRGTVEIMALDPNRRVPNLRIDRGELERQILEVLCKRGEVDFRDLRYDLKPNGWAKAYGIKPEEFERLWQDGVSIVNPCIEALDTLVSERKIKKRIDRRLEAGVENTPRYSYGLNAYNFRQA